MADGNSGYQSGLSIVDNVTETTTNNDVHNQAVTDTAGDTFGNKLQLTESSIGTFNTSDFGAISAAEQISLAGIGAASDAANRATDAARAGLQEAGTVLTNASQENLAGLLKIGGWVAVGLFALWLLFRSQKKGKS